MVCDDTIRADYTVSVAQTVTDIDVFFVDEDDNEKWRKLLAGWRKKGTTLSLCKYSENSMTELRGNS